MAQAPRTPQDPIDAMKPDASPPLTEQPAADRALNTSVTEDERTEGGPTDESGDPKLDTTSDI